jgi:hypothetical protein
MVARNADKVVPAAKSASEIDRDKHAVFVKEREHVLQCRSLCGGTLPAKLRRELFDHFSSLDGFDHDASVGNVEQTARLKERTAPFLHDHNGSIINRRHPGVGFLVRRECYSIASPVKGAPVKHKNIEYAIRARPGRDEWIWTLYPKNAPIVNRVFKGTRDEAVIAARLGIDRWLTVHPVRDA